MSPAETALFASFLRQSDHYLEFGAGGSTCFAATLVKSTITSIDSSRDWLDSVGKYVAAHATPTTPKLTLIHADIGPVRDWGYPADDTHRDKWPNYHGAIWTSPLRPEADLYMVDGRFRVACFIQIAMHCRPDSLIMFHDYAERKNYHAVEQIARNIATAEQLSIFQPNLGPGRLHMTRLLSKYEHDAG